MSLCDSCIHAKYQAASEPGKKPEDYPLCVAFHWVNEIITEFNEQVGARAYPIRDADIRIDVAECVGYSPVAKATEYRADSAESKGNVVAFPGGKHE